YVIGDKASDMNLAANAGALGALVLTGYGSETLAARDRLLSAPAIIADELLVEFEPGLNLLTGETGSGKSIIVDALGLLIGGRFASDLLKAGAARGSIEGLFSVTRNPDLESLLADAGIAIEGRDAQEIIIRREMTANGRNKIF